MSLIDDMKNAGVGTPTSGGLSSAMANAGFKPITPEKPELPEVDKAPGTTFIKDELSGKGGDVNAVASAFPYGLRTIAKVGGSMFQSIFGTKGALGLGQQAGKAIQAPVQQEYAKGGEAQNIASLDSYKSAQDLIERAKTEQDPNKKAQLLSEAGSIIKGTYESAGQTAKEDIGFATELTPDLRKTYRAALNTALAAAASKAGIKGLGEGEVAKNVAMKGVSKFIPSTVPVAEKVLSYGRNLVPKVAESVALGEGFNTAENIGEGRPVFENAGTAAAFSAVAPVAIDIAFHPKEYLAATGNLAGKTLSGTGKILSNTAKSAKESSFASGLSEGLHPTPKTEAEADAIIDGVFNKSIKPSVSGKANSTAVQKYSEAQRVVAKDIAKNADALSTGLPKTGASTLEAINERKGQVWDSVKEIEKAAGSADTQVPLSKATTALDTFINDRVLADRKPELVRYAQGLKETLSKRGSYNPEEAQRFITSANKDLERFYRNPSAGGEKAIIDAAIASTMRESLDEAMMNITGQHTEELRKLYGQFLTVERDVARAVNREANRSGVKFTSYMDAASALEAAHGIISMNPASLGASAAVKGVKSYLDFLGSTDKQIEQMFSRLGKAYENGTLKYRSPEGFNPFTYMETLKNRVSTPALSEPSYIAGQPYKGGESKILPSTTPTILPSVKGGVSKGKTGGLEGIIPKQAGFSTPKTLALAGGGLIASITAPIFFEKMSESEQKQMKGEFESAIKDAKTMDDLMWVRSKVMLIKDEKERNKILNLIAERETKDYDSLVAEWRKPIK